MEYFVSPIYSYFTVPTCWDGKMNQDETDTDCRGPNCPTCGKYLY